MADSRTAIIDNKRLATPCFFDEGMTYSEFAAIVSKVSRKIKRIDRVNQSGTTIECTVISQTACSTWKFTVNFNNWGHIDGRSWLHSENPDSCIPETFRDAVSSEIVQLLDMRGAHVPDMQAYVRNNGELGTSSCMSYRKRLGVLRRLIAKPKKIYIEKSSLDLNGEHFYPVISILKEKGFRSIASKPINDVDGNSPHFPLEVEGVYADGIPLDGIRPISEDTEILITYHAGRLIKPERGSAELCGTAHTAAANSLSRQGFSNVFLSAEKNLVLDILKKHGTVSKVTVDARSDDEAPLKAGRAYPYDAQITIFYREFRD